MRDKVTKNSLGIIGEEAKEIMMRITTPNTIAQPITVRCDQGILLLGMYWMHSEENRGNHCMSSVSPKGCA